MFRFTNIRSFVRAALLASALFCAAVPARAQKVVEKQDTIREARVTAIREKAQNSTQTGLTRLDSKQLKAGYAVFGSPDVIKTLQLQPGVAAGNELMSGLYVHGGDGSDNLFLLDGVPLYNVSHFGGLFSSFNTDVVDNLDFYKSGFPARFGGKMSSIVDVQTREGDMREYHGSASLGLIDGRLQFEGPIVTDKTSFNLGLRRTWLDIITTPAIAIVNKRRGNDYNVAGGYFMQDLNARVTHRFGEDNTLDACVYWGKDNLHANMNDSEGYGEQIGLDMGVVWGSLTASAAWHKRLAPKMTSTFRAYFSQSNSDIGYTFDVSFKDEDEKMGMYMDDSDVSFVRDLGVTADFDWFPNAFHHVRFGAQAVRHGYSSGRDYIQKTSYQMLEGGVPIPGYSYSETDKGGTTNGYGAWEPAAYIEDEWFILYNLSVNAGLRTALFATPGKVWPSLEPRAALKWQISPVISMKASFTHMAQFSHLVSAMYIDLPSNCWMPSTATVRPMVSDQVAGGIYTTPFKNFKLNVEGWYKTMDHLLAYNGANAFYPAIDEWEKSFVDGRGKSYGMEVEAEWRTRTLNLAAYYTLSKSLRRFDAFYPDWFNDRNDNPHKLNLVASWEFASGMEVFLNWNYHSGNRVTFPTNVVTEDGDPMFVYDKPYNTSLPDYHRLDAGFNFHKINRKGRHIITNLSVYNVYNRLNAAFALLDETPEGNYRGLAYGMVPIVPTLTFQYKF